MVRRGSTVRVRQRALGKCLQIGTLVLSDGRTRGHILDTSPVHATHRDVSRRLPTQPPVRDTIASIDEIPAKTPRSLSEWARERPPLHREVVDLQATVTAGTQARECVKRKGASPCFRGPHRCRVRRLPGAARPFVAPERRNSGVVQRGRVQRLTSPDKSVKLNRGLGAAGDAAPERSDSARHRAHPSAESSASRIRGELRLSSRGGRASP